MSLDAVLGVPAVGVGFSVKEWKHGGMGGPPLHVHHGGDEAWYVLEGALRFRLRDRSFDAPVGTHVMVPAGVAHTYGSDGDVRYLIIATNEIFELIEALHAPDVGDVAEVYRRFNSEIIG